MPPRVRQKPVELEFCTAKSFGVSINDYGTGYSSMQGLGSGLGIVPMMELTLYVTEAGNDTWNHRGGK